jgi:hypothetical protein
MLDLPLAEGKFHASWLIAELFALTLDSVAHTDGDCQRSSRC